MLGEEYPTEKRDQIQYGGPVLSLGVHSSKAEHQKSCLAVRFSNYASSLDGYQLTLSALCGEIDVL